MDHLSPEQRVRICTLIEEGHSFRSVARMEEIHHTTVSRIFHSYSETGSYQCKSRSGRPRLFCSRGERHIVRLLASNSCQTAVEIQSSLKISHGIHVSADTIRRVLTRNGLTAHIKRKSLFYTRNIAKNDFDLRKNIRIGRMKIGAK
jgi:transposase